MQDINKTNLDPILFITGGSGEIGKAIIQIFKDKHYTIIAPTRSQLDLNDSASIAHYMQHFGIQADIFIHCAGFNEPKPFLKITEQDFQKTFSINALSFFNLVQALVANQHLKNKASILGISSIYGSFSRKNRFSYTASKHCLNGMIKTLALELAPNGIKVNALSPGFVETRMTYQNNTEETIKKIKKKIPLGDLAKPQEIANVAYFLCSKYNTYITGQTIIVDGGYTIGGFEE
jgi:3-oxoacyl-[acyl-carrier protein] reductase